MGGNVTLSRIWRPVVGVLGGLLACGLPLWPIPYERVSMPGNPSATIWLLGGGAAGLLAGCLLRRGLVAPIGSVTLGFVLAVVGRVAVETSRDPTSHNLWPFEVIIAGGIGGFAAALGVTLARLFNWMRAPR
jgi:hypothetical protein